MAIATRAGTPERRHRLLPPNPLPQRRRRGRCRRLLNHLPRSRARRSQLPSRWRLAVRAVAVTSHRDLVGESPAQRRDVRVRSPRMAIATPAGCRRIALPPLRDHRRPAQVRQRRHARSQRSLCLKPQACPLVSSRPLVAEPGGRGLPAVPRDATSSVRGSSRSLPPESVIRRRP